MTFPEKQAKKRQGKEREEKVFSITGFLSLQEFHEQQQKLREEDADVDASSRFGFTYFDVAKKKKEKHLLDVHSFLFSRLLSFHFCRLSRSFLSLSLSALQVQLREKNLSVRTVLSSFRTRSEREKKRSG
jgi:hypothetical protein